MTTPPPPPLSHSPTAAMLIIGNEILSGRTADKNLHFIAGELTTLGIRLKESRVVSDDEAQIVAAVNALRKAYDYVFTSGGIGPTHDDITAAAMAKAFGRELTEHAEARARLETYYPEGERSPARMRMALTPEGATLIDNNISVAPGFIVENVYVMAGVPSIFQAMVKSLEPRLKHGQVILSREITLPVPESRIALVLGTVQERHTNVEIGSYPFGIEERKYGVNLVFRSTDAAAIDAAIADLHRSAPEHFALPEV